MHVGAYLLTGHQDQRVPEIRSGRSWSAWDEDQLSPTVERQRSPPREEFVHGSPDQIVAPARLHPGIGIATHHRLYVRARAHQDRVDRQIPRQLAHPRRDEGDFFFLPRIGEFWRFSSN